MRYALLLLLVTGCSAPPSIFAVDGGGDDAARDREVARDLSQVSDLTDPADLALAAVDSAPSAPDLDPAPDMGPVPDLSPVGDMQPACGAIGQPCCASSLCSAGICMRQTSTGTFSCIPGGGCGSYLTACCTKAGGATFSVDGYCERDQYAASDGNTLGWYRCFSGGCSP